MRMMIDQKVRWCRIAGRCGHRLTLVADEGWCCDHQQVVAILVTIRRIRAEILRESRVRGVAEPRVLFLFETRYGGFGLVSRGVVVIHIGGLLLMGLALDADVLGRRHAVALLGLLPVEDAA